MSVKAKDGLVKKRRSLVAQVGGVDAAVSQRLATENGQLGRYAVVNVSAVINQLKARADEEGVTSARLEYLYELLGGPHA